MYLFCEVLDLTWSHETWLITYFKRKAFSEMLVYGVFSHMTPCKAHFKPANLDWSRCCLLRTIILEFCLDDQHVCWLLKCFLTSTGPSQIKKESNFFLWRQLLLRLVSVSFVCMSVSLSEPETSSFWDVISNSKPIFSPCQVKVTANNSSTEQIPRLWSCRPAVSSSVFAVSIWEWEVWLV